MPNTKSRDDIIIPDDLATDRAVIQLVTAWKHAHARYRICSKRVNWKTKAAATIEKKRRREKWQVIARILEIERTLIKWCAKATKHRDIWMSKKVDAKPSRRITLILQYQANRQYVHSLVGSKRQLGMHRRERIVAEIRQLDRDWMEALYLAVFPGMRPPKAITLHPRELIPRKIVRASKELTKELA